MTSGSRFLFDLATWNQGTDDLRGVDVVAAVGNGGSGFTTGTKGFDDGVIALTSGSLEWSEPGRTRVMPILDEGGRLVDFVSLDTLGAER